MRANALKGITIRRTWCKDEGKGMNSYKSSPEASQRIGKVLVEMEASNRRDGSASAGEECWIRCGWILVQGFKESGSSIKIPALRCERYVIYSYII
jgi:hypothetical protein